MWGMNNAYNSPDALFTRITILLQCTEFLYADSINRGRNVSTNNPASNISASVILSVNL